MRGTIEARVRAHSGRTSRGKKVPEKRNMGMTNRKVGKLKESIWGTTPVKQRASPAKNSPARKEKGRITRAWG